MRAILKWIHFSFFKWYTDRKFEFGELTQIFAENGKGKSTIADGFYWVLQDKSYDLNSNPDIRPIGVEECTPTVTMCFDIDGKEITIAKMQKCKVSKPDENGVSKVSLTNTYEINSVPKSQRDFNAYLEDTGLHLDKLLVCSHPNIFTGQKQADMRQMLFLMASSKSDFEIASVNSDTAEVAKLLESYKIDEIKAMQTASKKKAVEQVDAIPNQIIGLEKAKVDIDVAELELAKTGLLETITEVDSKMENTSAVLSELEQKRFELQKDINGVTAKDKDAITKTRGGIENEKYDAERRLENTKSRINHAESEIESYNTSLSAADIKRNRLAKEYKEVVAREFDESPYLFNESGFIFDESDTVCKLCGQTLLEKDIEARKAEFEARKAKERDVCEQRLKDAKNQFDSDRKMDLSRIESQGKQLKDDIEKYKANISSLEQKLSESRIEFKNYEIAVRGLVEKLSALPAEPDMSGNKEYQKLLKQVADLDLHIATLKESDNVTDDLKAEKARLQQELSEVEKQIAQSQNNVRIDSQIEELRFKQREYEQAKADAEKILEQLKLVGKRKNEMLIEEINSNFDIVRWKLFEYQKNGDYAETCVPTVVENGKIKEYRDSMNTGLKIKIKLDICNSFQKFFGMRVPIFLDGAESINDYNLPKLDTQLITLNVSLDKEIRVEVE